MARLLELTPEPALSGLPPLPETAPRNIRSCRDECAGSCLRAVSTAEASAGRPEPGLMQGKVP